MPKMKTHSGAKKRFKLTATGKVKAGAAFKRHRMTSRSNEKLRNARGTFVLFKADGDNIKTYFLPNA